MDSKQQSSFIKTGQNIYNWLVIDEDWPANCDDVEKEIIPTAMQAATSRR